MSHLTDFGPEKANLAGGAGLREVPLAAVDLDDRTFAASRPQDLSRLTASLREVGLLAPPWLRPLPGNRWQPVAGFKRLRAAVHLGWERVPARTLPPGAPDSFCLLVSLYDNALGRGFDLSEQAWYASRLLGHWDRQTVAARFLPCLGLEPSQVLLERLLALNSLEEPFQALAARGRLALSAAASLADWRPEDRAAALPFLSQLHLSQSKQEEFLEALELLGRREDATPADILSRAQAQACLAGPGSPVEKAEGLRRLLRRWLSPRATQTSEAFETLLNRLGLRNHRRLRLTPPPAFEGPDFRLEVKFRDGPELRELLDELAGLLQREEFTALTRL